MEKQQRLSHKVNEHGNIEIQIVTDYLKDGVIISQDYSNPMSPADTSKMDGWDDRTKEIAEASTDSKVVADFATEKQEPTGIGIEEIISYEREIEEDGKIAVYMITRIFDEGKQISRQPCLSWIMPGDDSSKADVMSKALAEKLHTTEVVAAYVASQAELEAENVAEK